VKKIELRMFFECPEPWFGSLNVPDDFEDWDEDRQRGYLEECAHKYRGVWLDEWNIVD
jgi:hypothetical protein